MQEFYACSALDLGVGFFTIMITMKNVTESGLEIRNTSLAKDAEKIFQGT